ncbi:hypothetical protein GQ53DRAFT_102635 [Thozetella sp. PMI_491]|nr:hypothetical protein GQ53DRAFT_102635 [Thozetella sp. PMI_491]
MDAAWSALLCARQILQFATTAPWTEGYGGERRHTTTEEEPSYFGYSADSWLEALYAVAFFLDRRNGKKQMDRPHGQYDRGATLSVWRATDVDRGLLLDSGDQVEGNVATQRGIHIHQAARVRQRTIAAGPENLSQLIARGESRVSLLLRANYGTSLSRSNISSTDRMASITKQGAMRLVELPPLDRLSLAMVVSTASQFFQKPIRYELTGDLAERFKGLTNQGNLQDFMAVQSDLLDKMLKIARDQGGDVDTEEVRKELTRSVRNTAAVVSMTNAFPSAEVDYIEAARAAGFKTNAPTPGSKEPTGWKDLRPAPVERPDLNLKPHQLLDAYAMFLRESEPITTTLLANAVGMGKTFTCALVIRMAYLKLKAQKDNGEEITALPSISTLK